jgi:phage terminase small subunit
VGARTSDGLRTLGPTVCGSVSETARLLPEVTDRPRKPRVFLYDEPLPIPIPEQARNSRRSSPDELSKIELEFCFRWTATYQASRAAMEAGYNPASAHQTARRLLADPRIRRQVGVIESDRLRRLRFDGDKFLAREIMLAEADLTELQEVWIPPCRFCWGRNFEYQRTHAEFQEAFEAWMRLPDVRRRGQSDVADFGYGDVLVYDRGDAKIPFDQKGGDGYDVAQPPNPACPNCFGRGLEIPGYGSLPHVRWKDTRELSDVGKLLFGGVKRGSKGLEVSVRNQDAARGRLMNLLGQFLELKALDRRRGVSESTVGKPSLDFGLSVSGRVADLLTDDPRSYTDQQLDAMLASYGVTDVEDEGTEPRGEGEDS